ncbi:MAG: hypothetical protein HY554_06075 [Elusimicrobia bacterium]|nr:hypothetical protein [Elusimicrobiota bacterium]
MPTRRRAGPLLLLAGFACPSPAFSQALGAAEAGLAARAPAGAGAPVVSLAPALAGRAFPAAAPAAARLEPGGLLALPAAPAPLALPEAPAPAAADNRFYTPRLGALLDEAARFAGRAERGEAPAAAPAGIPAAPPARAGEAAAAAGPRVAPPLLPRPGSGRLRDAWLYARIYLSSLYWYTGPRLLERWKELRERAREGGDRPRAVRDLAGFFVAHRVLGSTGSYSPLGFRVASNRVVTEDALAMYDAYFAWDLRARAAFVNLLLRAEHFNPHRRDTQYRKVIFHALREAAALPPEEVGPFFDRQLDEARVAELARYQEEKQPKVLAAFHRAVLDVIEAMNAGAPAGKRVIGALLMGSFANGAAGPGSDLDVQAIAEGGRVDLNEEFLARLKTRWKAEAWTGSPVSGFQYALRPSKRLLARIHREPYLIVSPYPEVREALSRSWEEEREGSRARPRTRLGAAAQRGYAALLRTVLLGAPTDS